MRTMKGFLKTTNQKSNLGYERDSILSEIWSKSAMVQINSELEYERALLKLRKLRVLSQSDISLKGPLKDLQEAIIRYEKEHWQDPTESTFIENEHAQAIVEDEHNFLRKRKEIIRVALKEKGLNQQDLGKVLGHKSKTHMSELVNGIRPFRLEDILLISQLLEIRPADLLPKQATLERRKKAYQVLEKMNRIDLAVKLSSTV